ncbi:hypothetical protein [Dactylosporangium darangshiense]
MSKFKTITLVLAVSALTLLGVSGCNGSGQPGAGPSPSAGSDQDQALQFAQCMRDHAVDMPDSGDGGVVTGAGDSVDMPDSGDGGVVTGAGPGTDAGNVAAPLNADDGAFDTCRKFLPNGGEPRKLTAAELEQMVQYAQCMRAHGVDYPDPSGDGVQQAVGVPVGDDAARQLYDAAARACDATNSPVPTK